MTKIPAHDWLAPPLPELDHGTPGDDLIVGSGSNDFLYLRKTGADTIQAGGGDDFINVRDQDGGDLLDGGDGDDTLILNYRGVDFDIVIDLTDPDRLQTIADGTRIVRIERLDFKGGSGDDSIVGGGADFLDGGSGNDTLEGPAASMSGGGGNDLLRRADEDFDNLDLMSGGRGRDTVIGSSGREFLSGDEGNDTVDAGAGDDQANGGDGRDLVFGGDGDDIVLGDEGRDTVAGGAGDDYVIVGAADGIDHLDGGEGLDALDLDRTGSDTAFRFAFDGPSPLRLADGTFLVGFETLIFQGGNGDDRVFGGALADRLSGGAGNDVLEGGSGKVGDELDGQDGNDTLIGTAGFDTMEGGYGDDLIITSRDGDLVIADAPFSQGGDDTVIGGAGDDRIYVGFGADSVSAGGGDDIVSTRGPFGEEPGPDTLDGGAGHDLLSYAQALSAMTVNLRTGVDSSGSTISGFEDVDGSASDDRLTGDGGDNVLWGLAGSDTLRGGGGADRFVFGSEVHFRDFLGQLDDPDVVRDFSHDEGDRIDLHAIDAIRRNGQSDAFTLIGSDAFRPGVAGELRVVEQDGVFTISGDRDGDAVADFEILVRSDAPLTADDFVL